MLHEDDMRRALGLQLKPDPVAQFPARSPKLRVELSVREVWGGPTRKFTHEVVTISALDATIQAQRKAREAGLTVWCVLDVAPVS